MDEERFTEPYQDPGWGVVFATRAGDEGVALLRRLFLALLSAPFLILVILFFVIDDVGEMSFPIAAAIFALGVSGIWAAAWTSRRPLPVDTPENLALSYRTNFFLGFALNEAPLLISFVFCFLEEEIWPYLVAFPLYLVGMAVVAPSPNNLARVQQQILGSGSSMQLGRVLGADPRGARSDRAEGSGNAGS